MRPRFEKVITTPERSFRVEERRLERFDAPWHFHPEIELTLIVSSEGRRFVGDSIEPFKAGDLVLLGPNLPHFWHTHRDRRSGAKAHSIVLQFSADLLPTAFLALRELNAVRRLLAQCRRGLVFNGPGARRVAARLHTLATQTGTRAIVELLLILDELARSRARPLASTWYEPPLHPQGEERLARVYDYLLTHFRQPLPLARLAQVAAMSPAAFSRYFKRRQGRNVSEVLTELRIDHAARCLVETKALITTIAHASGFDTLSSFNRHFLRLKNLTPRQYRRTFQTAEAEAALPSTSSGRFSAR